MVLSVADELLPGNDYLQSVFVLRPDDLKCLRICGSVMQIHKVHGCRASVCLLMFAGKTEEMRSHMNVDELIIKMLSFPFLDPRKMC